MCELAASMVRAVQMDAWILQKDRKVSSCGDSLHGYGAGMKRFASGGGDPVPENSWQCAAMVKL